MDTKNLIRVRTWKSGRCLKTFFNTDRVGTSVVRLFHIYKYVISQI